MYITLEQAKKHLLVDEDFRADDMYILDLIAVAEDSVSKHLDIALDELERGCPKSVTAPFCYCLFQ